MEINLNGKKYGTSYIRLSSLKNEIYEKLLVPLEKQPETIWIVDGFQTDADMELHEGINVSYITKGKFPPKDELETMMAARHTPGLHKKIKDAHVAVAGLGGLGSNIAVMLARTGVGHLHLIDFDVVEPSNLNRQQYFISHLGMKKTEAMKQLLSQINPYIKVTTDDIKVDEGNCQSLFASDEIICEAFDKVDAKTMLAETILSGMPDKILISASGMAGYGDSNLIVTKEAGKNFFVCGDMVNGARPGMGLMAPRVTICAAHQANLVVRLIAEKNA